MRLILLLLSLLFILILSGCETTDNAKNVISNAIDEIIEGYENITGKVTDTKNWVEEKVNQTEQAAEDVQEAANSVNDAVDSIKVLTGNENEAESSPLTAENN